MHKLYTTLFFVLLATSCGATSRLPRADAERIALERVSGTVVEVEQETDDGRAITEVVVRGADGRLHGVEIDEATREVIRVEDESAESDDDDEDGETDEAGGDLDDDADEDAETDEHEDEDGETDEAGGDLDDDADEDSTDEDHDGATDEH